MENEIIFTTDSLSIKTKDLILKDLITVILNDGSRWGLDVQVKADQFDTLPVEYHILILNVLLRARTAFDFSYKEKVEIKTEVKKPWWRFW